MIKISKTFDWGSGYGLIAVKDPVGGTYVTGVFCADGADRPLIIQGELPLIKSTYDSTRFPDPLVDDNADGAHERFGHNVYKVYREALDFLMAELSNLGIELIEGQWKKV